MGSRIKESPESTFEAYLEVSHPGTHSSKPEVRRQFPEDYTDQETLQTVPKFCFPFSMDSLTVNQVGQNFTFVLTDIESKQRFGFCRLSSGAHTCYCILSYLPWFEVFYKLLNILADYTIKGQESQWQELLLSLHELPIPEPGVPVHLGVHSFFTVPDTRELPSIPENRNLTEYFVAVDVNNMLHLYASMLYERRILICCSKLSTLTACVHGSAAMLYPMHWQHVYIPVLPQHLLDYCCAPMPYLIGVHSSLMEKVRGMALDDVVVLNVDTNTLETPFDDLQSLPNDVVSSLKSRLKKVSTTTGDGVARAFLKSQAALFSSYRNALQIESGEPITFNEETFVNHRSSAMRQFLQNAIQLQLFKQFIDGRLDLLNSGEGFSDIFEEEINMSEYAGSDKTYHQWLFTVKKGGGAIFNTVKTKANPAMKTVYKFAKDHAKMRIKEVKSRLKQKEQAENGLSTGGSAVIDDDGSAGVTSSTGAVRREGPLHTWDDHRPITVHFGQVGRNDPEMARPPMLLKRPSSNVSLESSVDQPQPYRSLKEVELIEGDDPGFGAESHTAPPSPVNEKFSNINLLGDIFGCHDEPDSQPMTLAKSLEDLRTPKDPGELQAKFTYQRMDLSVGEHSRTLPGLKLSNPYNKLWSVGQDETALPVCAPPPCDRPPSVQLPVQPEAHSPSCEISGLCPDPLEPSTPGNITIPRPHGRKTPELGTVLAPPVAQSRSKAAGASEGRTTLGGQEFRQALSMTTDEDLLKPSRDSIDLISLLDPLNISAETSSTSLHDGVDIGMSSSSCKPTLPPRSYPQGLPPYPVHPHISLNPFAQSLQHTSSHMHYSPTVRGNPFSAVCGPPPGSYLHTPQQPQSFSTLPGLYRQHSPGSSTLPPSYGLLQSTFPSSVTSLPPSSASNHALSSLADSMSAPPTAMNPLAKPLRAEGDSQKSQDPFGDLLTMAKPATPQKKKVEDLRRRWETFD
ncbi:DENN domain-containing protein 1A isoform X1 [Seriola lalandi dorsalis]|uniref:DENN domain-containing protein 1A isoform X1 n=1 Tax=Seriola lalandi dorsalis TaxID=1841481 RepID=UPI000C6F478D|nr:DENN domain-containing protein 1A isoform X1 [Seriola lalandi dorsalis]XP_056260252.1 DENN domain-containing protein 1A isoform X4 [Seriola aureovittata]